METTIRFHCSVKDKPFDVTFERQGKSWQIIEIEAVRRSFTLKGLLHQGTAQATTDFVAKEAIWDRFQCPWCGGKKMFGGYYFVCPKCNRPVCGSGMYLDDDQILHHPCTKKCGYHGLSTPEEQNEPDDPDDTIILKGTQNAAQLGRPERLALPPKK